MSYTLLDLKKLSGKILPIHFIGIGGIGMSGIAAILYHNGYKVQGSDLSKSGNTEKLESIGIKVFIGHDASNVKDVEFIVISSDIKDNNIELIEAKRLGIPVIRRAEMLAELMRLKVGISISGTHGKTTTTSLVGHLLESAKLNPTVINGGIINSKLTNAYLGEGVFLVAEADESDATFIQIPSTIAVITNIDPEHMNYYGTFEALLGAFESFIRNLPFYGFAVACIDHEEVKKLISKIHTRKIITYSIEDQSANVFAHNIRLTEIGSTFNVTINIPHEKSIVIEDIMVPILGLHNVQNATAAISIAAALDVPNEVIKNGFSSFQGVKRRFTLVSEYNNIKLIDDYAHHPKEVKATLSTARMYVNESAKKTGIKGRVIAVFQPHRYSRIATLFSDFLHCFEDADITYISEIYAAGEKNTYNISHMNLIEAIKQQNVSKGQNKSISELKDQSHIEEIIRNIAKPEDVIVCMGAGSISSWAYSIAKNLETSENFEAPKNLEETTNLRKDKLTSINS